MKFPEQFSMNVYRELDGRWFGEISHGDFAGIMCYGSSPSEAAQKTIELFENVVAKEGAGRSPEGK